MRCQSIPSLCLCSNNVVDALICLIDLILLILMVTSKNVIPMDIYKIKSVTDLRQLDPIG